MRNFNENKKEIKNKASSLYDTAKENAASAYYDTKPKAHELIDQVSTTASDLYTSGMKKMNQAEGYIEESMHHVTQGIRKQPITSVFIAAGIGYLFAKFFK